MCIYIYNFIVVQLNYTPLDMIFGFCQESYVCLPILWQFKGATTDQGGSRHVDGSCVVP